MILDKANSDEISWYVIFTRPHQEEKLKQILELEQKKRSNILEIFCPLNKVVRVQRNGKEVRVPYFANYVFVNATEDALQKVLTEKYPEGYLVFDKCSKKVMTIPEPQMRLFIDFNVHYPEDVIVLERPYANYAFNPKNQEPNDAVLVADGPFKGLVGYFVRFRGNRRLVFQLKNYKEAEDNGKQHDLVISIPDIWNYPLVRLHNIQQDKLSLATKTSRVVDYFWGKFQSYGLVDNGMLKLEKVLEALLVHPSLIDYCKQEKDPLVRDIILGLSPDEATKLMTLVQFLKTEPLWLNEHWNYTVLRPFLTETALGGQLDGDYVELKHQGYTEVIVKVTLQESVFDPEKNASMNAEGVYYAHIGIVESKGKKMLIFADWTKMLGEYFMLEGTALDKQNDIFKNYSPTFYEVLMGKNEVAPMAKMKIGQHYIHSLGSILEGVDVSTQNHLMDIPVVARQVEKLAHVGSEICEEINRSTHLALWRRFLRTVWLHK